MKRLVLIAVFSVLAAGCGGFRSLPTGEPLDDYGFLGEVVDVGEARSWDWQLANHTFLRGGPDSEARVGPGTFTLRQGTTIAIGEDTPGPIPLCNPSINWRNRGNGHPDECIITGEWASDGTAAWYGVVSTSITPLGDILTIGLPLKALAPGRALVDTGWDLVYIPLDDEVEWRNCPDPPAASGEGTFALSRSGGPEARIDLERLVVIGAYCEDSDLWDTRS